MEVLAIIPARGGSKGVPRKNVKMLGGRPLIGWTVDAACQAASVSRVVVSTDDGEVAEAAKMFGAEVVWRPQELAGDEASSESALLHVLEHLKEQENYVPDVLVFLQCTSPLTGSEDIDAAVRKLADDAKVDSVVSVAPSHGFLWREDERGEAVGINHDKSRRLRRQDREPEFVETGAVYVMRTAGFLEAKHRFFGHTAMAVMPSERCREIDEPYDFKVAEMLKRRQADAGRLERLPQEIDAVVFDFDGVFTDNRVMVFDDGREGVVCSRGDGLGIARLRKHGVRMLVLSTEENPVVMARCRKLKLECIHGCADKLPALRTWAVQQGVRLSRVVYVGNDVNDLDCLKEAGCGVVVQDAAPEVLPYADIVLESRGGDHAVREVCRLISERLEISDV